MPFSCRCCLSVAESQTFLAVFPQVRALENKMDFPTRHDWDSFFRDAKDMNETLPGERPDTIHLEGLPCRWFSQKDSQFPDRPSEDVLSTVFESFGKVFSSLHFLFSIFNRGFTQKLWLLHCGCACDVIRGLEENNEWWLHYFNWI